MSIVSSLEALKLAKSDIADAITGKGVTVSLADGFADFADKVRDIKPPSDYGLITFTAAVPTAANIMVS